jgi:hypothetical protein
MIAQIFFALILVAEAPLRPTPPAPVSLCGYIDQWRGTNLPISPPRPETDITHAIALAVDGTAVGWLVTRRDGKTWYFDGPVNANSPPRDYSTLALNALHLEKYARANVGVGQMIPLSAPVQLSSLSGSGIGIYTCY